MFDDDTRFGVFIFGGSMDTHPILEFQEKIKYDVLIASYNFIIDVRRVTYISSSGLGFLMYMLKYKRETVFLSQPPEVILKPFNLLGIGEFFKFYRDFDELAQIAALPKEFCDSLKNEVKSFSDVQYKDAWVKVLKDYLALEEVSKEMEKMASYIKHADTANSITLPSEEKYACILYKFLDRVLNREVNLGPNSIDAVTVELVAKELMENAVQHGYDFHSGGVVESDFKVDGNKLEISVIDYGRGFSAGGTSKSTLPPTGLQLIRKIFDEVLITDAPRKRVHGLILGKGTHVKMIKYLRPKL
jgi:anti-anti-sigma factor